MASTTIVTVRPVLITLSVGKHRLPAELLEMVLSHLPMRDLLFAQAVCRCWQTLIENSLLLQQLLFMQPAPVPPLGWLDWRYDRQEMYAVRLGEPLSAKRTREIEYPPHWGRSRDDHGLYRVFVNPMLAQHLQVLSAIVLDGGASGAPRGMDNAEASWKKMLVTQPAVDTMIVEYERLEGQRWGRERGWSVFPLTSSQGQIGITGACLDTCFRRLNGLAWLKGRQLMEEFEGRQSLERILKYRK